MAPRVTFRIDGSLRKRIFDNSQIHWPIISENNLVTFDGQNPSIKTKDKESKVVVEATGSIVKTQFIYAIDVDDKPGNGRVYMEDEFVFDPQSKDFNCNRTFRLMPGIDETAWKNFADRLIARQNKKPFTPDNPDVRKFFEKVVLELPTPTAVEGEEGKPAEVQPTVSLPDPIFFNLTPPNPPYSLDASHFRRMSLASGVLAAAFEKIPGSLDLLQAGLATQRNGFLKKNASWEGLHRMTAGDPSLHFLSGALLCLSRGDLKDARFRLMPLKGQEPAADYLFAWIDGYERALKNLYLLRPAKALALEETGRFAKADKALLSSGEAPVQPEQVRKLFQVLERKLVTGEADTLDQALSQFSSVGSKEEAALAKKLLSKDFANGGFADLSKVSGLPAPLADPLLMTVAREKWLPSGYASAGLLLDDLGEFSKERDVALAARKYIGLSWGGGPVADQFDLNLGRAVEGVSDPVLIGSLMLGQGAFRLSQRYALERFGGLGLRTTLAATGLGLTAEAPAFELAHRVLSRTFTGEVAHQDFFRASARNWLTFGALRGAGLGVQLNSSRILSLSPYSPFGAYTLPVAEHGASFGALHLMNEGERSLGLRPSEGPWNSRLLSDGVFYLQAGAASYLAGLGGDPHLTREIRGLEGFNRVMKEMRDFKPERREIKLLPPHIEGTPQGDPETPVVPLKTSEPVSSPSAVKPLRLLAPGESVLATALNEPKNPRREEVYLRIPQYGEVAAYTHEGIDKKHMDGKRPYPMNEDAFGIMVDSEGRPFLMVADGMGGHDKGETASKLGVEIAVEAVRRGEAPTPGNAFLAADGAIRESYQEAYGKWFDGGSQGEAPTSGTVASAARINPDGTVEVALSGDARLWVIRSRADGIYQVIEPVLPHFEPTALRLSGTLRNSLEANSHEKSNRVLSGLGQSNRPRLTQAFDYGEPGDPKNVLNQIYDSVLTLPPGDGSPGETFKLQKGDALLLMSDGVANFFSRDQMAGVLRGKTNAQDMLEAVRKESNERFNIFRILSQTDIKNGERMKMKVGSFKDKYIDRRGGIYDSKDLSDTNLVGKVGRDNAVALVYLHDPSPDGAPPAAPQGPPTEAPLTVAILPGEHHSLTDLSGVSDPQGLFGKIRLRRGEGPSGSNYWLLMTGGTELSLTREFGEDAGRPVTVSGGENLIVGEIGETIRLQVPGHELPVLNLFLDGPQGEGQRLPAASLNYGGRAGDFRFRSTTPSLSFGRTFNPDFFPSDDPLIADHYFDVAASLSFQERGYLLTARSPQGLYLGEKFLAAGQEFFILPGRHEIRPADAGGAVINPAAPLELNLPKTEVLFPEWLPREPSPISSKRGGATSLPLSDFWVNWARGHYQKIVHWVRSWGKGT